MIGRPRRYLSQRSHRLIQEIRANADRLRQIDAGLAYRRHAIEMGRGGEERPLHVGPQIELKPNGDVWSAV